MVQEVFDWIFITIGLLVVSKFLRQVKRVIINIACGPNIRKYRGGWAVVTGGSDGIGKALAEELARNGFNIVLIARNTEKLTAVSQEISKAYNVQVRQITADFGNANHDPHAFYQAIYRDLETLDISILVNNVGIGTAAPFENDSIESITKSLMVNTWPQLMMTHMLLPKLKARPEPSAIINVSSISHYLVLPTSLLYAATKAYDYHFSQTLAYELKAEGDNVIDVLTLAPGFVDTKLAAKVKGKFAEITPRECATGCLKALGYVDYTAGGLKHVLLDSVLSCLPSTILCKSRKSRLSQFNQSQMMCVNLYSNGKDPLLVIFILVYQVVLNNNCEILLYLLKIVQRNYRSFGSQFIIFNLYIFREFQVL